MVLLSKEEDKHIKELVIKLIPYVYIVAES